MATQLALYNEALRLLGERKLASLSESREPRRLLDDVWASGERIDYWLEQGQWNFAMRTVEIDYDPTIEPTFGYRRAFAKPTDWKRTAGVASDEYFNSPLTKYTDEAGYWYADLDTIYVRFVSNGASYGADLTRWPQSFVRYCAADMAKDICEKLTQNATKFQVMERAVRKALTEARSRDAMNEGAAFMPQGSWVTSRGRTRNGRDPWR